jgi:hypothetical protein
MICVALQAYLIADFRDPNQNYEAKIEKSSVINTFVDE